MLQVKGPMTDHFGLLYFWIKIVLGAVFVLGYLLGELLSGKTAKLRLFVLVPISVLFLVWFFFF